MAGIRRAPLAGSTHHDGAGGHANASRFPFASLPGPGHSRREVGKPWWAGATWGDPGHAHGGPPPDAGRRWGRYGSHSSTVDTRMGCGDPRGELLARWTWIHRRSWWVGRVVNGQMPSDLG
ncbi:hypothetical protein [Kibdelosporangium philippinense]|uniref:hypothetical protein n=1 Tax=Kibdelosporangium philippinense TaxID=211113 RepID=UPI003617C815